eukprot:6182086-Pleurochrysis_carterae.AAC.1
MDGIDILSGSMIEIANLVARARQVGRAQLLYSLIRVIRFSLRPGMTIAMLAEQAPLFLRLGWAPSEAETREAIVPPPLLYAPAWALVGGVRAWQSRARSRAPLLEAM